MFTFIILLLLSRDLPRGIIYIKTTQTLFLFFRRILFKNVKYMYVLLVIYFK